MDISGLRHLRKLIEKKARVSYGSQRVSLEAAIALSRISERFETWALKSLEDS
jgi:hypothetical protein